MQAVDRFSVERNCASHIIVRAVAVMAARVLRPGTTRLKLVKIAHNLGNRPTVVELPPYDHDGSKGPSEPTRRAA